MSKKLFGPRKCPHSNSDQLVVMHATQLTYERGFYSPLVALCNFFQERGNSMFYYTLVSIYASVGKVVGVLGFSPWTSK
ncbi:hypothetical protein CEXT_687901 [Caerostris extrusa]|uniref:Uncharacterized protein n=1 Tax=Caerostris extrusa TaxID=172846 RepID=A0AAV4QTN6_CAEEX|nr:hypothetical protein CEXT_687901 [Caerostris extrusa]